MTSPARLESVGAGDGFTRVGIAADMVGVDLRESVDRGQSDMSTFVVPTRENEHTPATTEVSYRYLKLFEDDLSLISLTSIIKYESQIILRNMSIFVLEATKLLVVFLSS